VLSVDFWSFGKAGTYVEFLRIPVLAAGLGLALVIGSFSARPASAQTETTTAESESTTAEVAAPEAPPVAEGPSNADLKVMVDTVWVLVAGMLVFFMNLGFGCVESGFCRAKNCVNILSKNFIVFAATSIGFLLLGFGIMFGDGGKYFGSEGLLALSGADNSPATAGAYEGAYGSLNWTGVSLYAKFFFQLVFAGTAATIVSGAVAERIKYHSFILFTFIMSILIYPVIGHWIWGGGMLALGQMFGENKGMFDFAGSTVVHSVGGWAALAGILVLGPRIGKYGPGGKINAIPGHNMTAATIGCFVLWFGWFGFNPGSTMAADISAIGRVCVTTNTAAAAATLTATITAWLMLGKPDLGMTLNGALAGLVAITAPCMYVTVGASVLIGAIAGVLVVLSVIMFDRLRIDDPVGATSVHLVNGVFGTLCVGLFGRTKIMQSGAEVTTGLAHDGFFVGGGMDQLIPQVVGILATGAYVFGVSLIAWLVLKATVGIRVSEQEEMEGLDIGEHGNEAYHGFVMASLPQR
jgi:Amt family ammonium transporter